METKLAIFKGKEIRRTLHENKIVARKAGEEWIPASAGMTPFQGIFLI